MNLDSVNHFVHAYRMTPWRVQRQWIVTFLLAVITLAMVAALYLDVTAQAAITGRRIQDMTYQMSIIQQSNGDLETRLAGLTSASVMEQRASDLGYRPDDPENIEYLVVPGYVATQPEILTATPRPDASAPGMPSEYTQSLLDWFDQAFQKLGEGR
jgi:cell division protein FtsL